MLGFLIPEQDAAKKKVEEHFNPKMKKSSYISSSKTRKERKP
jgi:hypothetical protein